MIDEAEQPNSSEPARTQGDEPVGSPEPQPGPLLLNEEQQQRVLLLARQTVHAVATTGLAPELHPDSFEPALHERRACFVTLFKEGALRGCIGHIFPQGPLYEAIVSGATGAASKDPRFSPVAPDEVGAIHIEVSVLTEPRPLRFSSPEQMLSLIEPGRHGVVLRIGCQVSTFLPQVWEHLRSKTDFMDRLAQKSGNGVSAWRDPDVGVSVYEVQSFEEHVDFPPP